MSALDPGVVEEAKAALERLVVHTAMHDAGVATECDAAVKRLFAALSDHIADAGNMIPHVVEGGDAVDGLRDREALTAAQRVLRLLYWNGINFVLHADGASYAQEAIDKVTLALSRRVSPTPAEPGLKLPSQEWLNRKIAADPDEDCEAGRLHPEAPVPAEPGGMRDDINWKAEWEATSILRIADHARIAELEALIANPPKHSFWGAGERDCPQDIKAPNGELHTLRCRVCGQDDPRNPMCLALSPPTAGVGEDHGLVGSRAEARTPFRVSEDDCDLERRPAK